MYFCPLGPLRWHFPQKNCHLQSQNLAWCGKSLVQKCKFLETAQTIRQSRHRWLPASIHMVVLMPEIFIRNDEVRIHQFSELLQIWIFVPPWTCQTKLNFNVMCDCFFANIVAEVPWKHKYSNNKWFLAGGRQWAQKLKPSWSPGKRLVRPGRRRSPL